MTRPRSCRVAALGFLVALGVFAVADDANAAGYTTARYGTDYGTPATPNGYATYFNPAALGGTTGTTLTGDLSVLARFIRYTRPASALSPDTASVSDPAYVKANTGTAQMSNLLALPYLGVNTDFGTKNLRAGYAFYIPFGGLATWNRRAGEHQRRYPRHLQHRRDRLQNRRGAPLDRRQRQPDHPHALDDGSA